MSALCFPSWRLLLSLLIGHLGISPLLAADPLYVLDFKAQKPGSALPWLKKNGFESKLDFEALRPRFEDGALWLTTEKPAAGLCGLIFPEGRELRGARFVRLLWGAKAHPEGADWEHGINRLALAVNISFGRERLSSGLPFGLYAAPYFISPFLGEKDPDGKIYTGRFWRQGGRYVCVQAAPAGEVVVTELNLEKLFRACFGRSDLPPVTAFGFQMNSKDTKGKASPFLQRIEFRAEPTEAAGMK